MPQFSFDANEFAPQPKSFEPLPAGMYTGMVIESAIKPTKAGTGEYIELVIQIVDGEHSGRRLWERLNVSNPNKTAEDIAKAALAELCYAVNVQRLTATEQLHDVPFALSVEIDRKDPSRNRVMGYKQASSAAAPRQAAPAAPAGQKASRPWAK